MDTEALLKSVSDPSDFPDERAAPGLRSLDHALRCNICGEFFDGPVTLPCGHGFCSLCIREHMRQESNCPMCRVSASESSLRKNIAMEEAVAAWTPARPLILRLVSDEKKSITEREANPSTTPSNAVNGKKRKRSSEGTFTTQEAGPSKVQKAKPAADSRKNSGQSPKSPIRVDERDDEVEMVNTSDIEEADAVDPVVNCPMCAKSVLESRINPHIDSGCKTFLASKGQNVNNWLKIFPGRAKGKEKQTDDTSK
ncbi:RING/U-box [Rickenella mellea]|uniref:Postreplication repair E3 ubiquitin-protein ligase RAD18 n=1 Tax=Rickenella mellea TaxID=50990 RepID=A0A4Y7PFB3_9AGAM|nr:RING/U-box [Rickenella mellea]